MDSNKGRIIEMGANRDLDIAKGANRGWLLRWVITGARSLKRVLIGAQYLKGS